MPGKVVGMYSSVPSSSGGMNSDPSLKNTGTVRTITRNATAMVFHLCSRANSQTGW